MPLPTVADAKAYLRIDADIADEDTLVLKLLTRSQGDIERFLGYALTAVARTHVNYSERDNYGVQPELTLPGPFETTTPVPVVTDRDGTTVDATTYYLDDRGLRLLAKAGYSFPTRPYTIVATIGLSAHPDYTAILEAVASEAILEFVAYRYHNRNPAIVQESDEGGGARTLSTSPIPPRVLQSLLMLPGAEALLIR